MNLDNDQYLKHGILRSFNLLLLISIKQEFLELNYC